MTGVSRRTLLAGSLAGAAVAGGVTSPAYAGRVDESVAEWIRRNAAPLGDLRQSIGGAQLVGLGEAVHSTAEITRLKHRVLRYLVERMGFRAIAFEEDWSLCTQVNEYVRTGRGDLKALIGQMSQAWRSQELADVLEYVRTYNARHRDKVYFAGVEYYATRQLAYDAIDEYVARHAPDRLAELRRSLKPIRPNTTDMGAYVRWYWKEVADKAPYISKARAVYELVRDLPDQEIVHHARQIVSFYEAFSLPENEIPAYRDARAAENVRWVRRHTGDKVVYWAASAHTANAPGLRVTAPPYPDTVFPSAGSYLKRWYGERYRILGFTFESGTTLGPMGPIDMPPASPDWFEYQLRAGGTDVFSLDLRRPAHGVVRDWLEATAKTRGYPEVGAASWMTGGSISEWYDVLVHCRRVTAVRAY
ncbi:erythromycin esterase family protein [Kribbella sp. NPDC050124]|uniref:erythromycin esterase family protein n=1 Tax=Kribbella sp. NPDC050124 TaxID=3364114 RepID=UPI0037A91129